jgi:hypothetical protein
MKFLCLALILLNGCISVSNSPTPRFYVLEALDKNKVEKKINIISDIVIGVNPVKIPEYIDRPQFVTINEEKMLTFAQFERWGEPLALGVARLVREDLTVIMPRVNCVLYPWNPSVAVKYQVEVEIVQLNSELDKDLFLSVQWLVVDTQNTKTIPIKRSEFKETILLHNYAGLVKALSTACASLSVEIAEAIETIEKTKKNSKA